MRFLRLAIGIWAIISAWQTNEALVGLMGGVLIAMAGVNVGCCGAATCTSYSNKNNNSSKLPGEVNYEEIS